MIRTNQIKVFVDGKCVGNATDFPLFDTPIEQMLHAVVHRWSGSNWIRINHRRFCGQGAFIVICESNRCRALKDLRFLAHATGRDPRDYVEVVPYIRTHIGAEGRFQFILPVTVWLGVCRKCGTVYWDRD